jgi:hypothetical protein
MMASPHSTQTSQTIRSRRTDRSIPLDMRINHPCSRARLAAAARRLLVAVARSAPCSTSIRVERLGIVTDNVTASRRPAMATSSPIKAGV